MKFRFCWLKFVFGAIHYFQSIESIILGILIRVYCFSSSFIVHVALIFGVAGWFSVVVSQIKYVLGGVCQRCCTWNDGCSMFSTLTRSSLCKSSDTCDSIYAVLLMREWIIQSKSKSPHHFLGWCTWKASTKSLSSRPSGVFRSSSQ